LTLRQRPGSQEGTDESRQLASVRSPAVGSRYPAFSHLRSRRLSFADSSTRRAPCEAACGQPRWRRRLPIFSTFPQAVSPGGFGERIALGRDALRQWASAPHGVLRRFPGAYLNASSLNSLVAARTSRLARLPASRGLARLRLAPVLGKVVPILTVGPTRVCTTDARESGVPNLTCPAGPAPKPLFPNPSRSS
jgi:hypothetical protein